MYYKSEHNGANTAVLTQRC